MPITYLLGLSTSLCSPKAIGACPFYDVDVNSTPQHVQACDKDAATTDCCAPSVWGALRRSSVCMRRALNTRMIGFCDPTVATCSQALLLELRAAGVLGRDAAAAGAAAREVRRHLRGAVDPHTLPWPPREQYTQWLRKRGRLVDTSDGA